MNTKFNKNFFDLSFLLILSVFSFNSCSDGNHSKIKAPELEKVISHYSHPADSVKLLAAHFLIDNIENKYSINNRCFFSYRDTIIKYKDSLDILEKTLNSMKDRYSRDVILDASHINADYLIENVDLAMEIYNKSSWKKEIDFDTFCEYILPYKIGNEALIRWRKQVLADVNDTVFNDFKMMEAAKIFVEKLSKNKESYALKWGKRNLNLPDLPYSILNKLPMGSCNELNNYTVFYLRGLGIPCAVDFAPQYANYNTGHSWSSIIVNENECIPFIIPVKDTLGVYKEEDFRLAKVYRNIYSGKNKDLASLAEHIKNAPLFLKNPCVIDVTDQYVTTADIEIKVSKKLFDNSGISFLSLFYKFKWNPIVVGKRKFGKAYFKKMGLETVYLPLSSYDDKLVIENYPFIIDENKRVNYLKPNMDSLITLNVLRKFPLQKHIISYVNRMIGGVFEGANKPNFSDADTLYCITKSPGQYYNNVEISTQRRYRYVRYVGSAESHCNIAELFFYNGNKSEDPLTGQIITNGESYSATVSKEKAFDGNEITFYDTKGSEYTWVGLDLGKQEEISKIRFIARTDYNIIVEGNLYEVYYWDNKWIPLGRQVATGNVLMYKNVPSECLYFIRNLTEGVEERIFTYKDGKQVWR